MYWLKNRGAAVASIKGNDNVAFNYTNDNRSSIYWNNSLENCADTYYLCTAFRNSIAVERNFTDNDIYEFILNADTIGNNWPSVICNRSIISFVLFNVPSDIWSGTDNSTDSDSDGLSDHMELNMTYGYSTNPFLSDTDNDGFSDFDEVEAETDPNDYTDSPET